MSTRATYKFTGKNSQPTVTYYVHYDGYPEGAASYFYNAVMLENQRGGIACAFMRANDLAELTRSHESHGDTEYRWTLDGDNLTGESRMWWGTDGSENWRTCYLGTLENFINANSEFHKSHVTMFGGRYFSQHSLRQYVVFKLENAASASKNGWTGNCASYVNDAWKAVTHLVKVFGNDDIAQHALGMIDNFDKINALEYNWHEKFGSEEAAIQAWKERFRTPESETSPATVDPL